MKKKRKNCKCKPNVKCAECKRIDKINSDGKKKRSEEDEFYKMFIG